MLQTCKLINSILVVYSYILMQHLFVDGVFVYAWWGVCGKGGSRGVRGQEREREPKSFFQIHLKLKFVEARIEHLDGAKFRSGSAAYIF